MENIVARLSEFATSELSDTLDELGIHGVLTGLSAQRVGQGRVAGRALPVHLVSKSGDPAAYRFGGGVGKPLEQVLKTMADGDVVIMDLQGANHASAWGGLACYIGNGVNSPARQQDVHSHAAAFQVLCKNF